MSSLTGRVAAITGASSGIGLACANLLAREGVAVMLGARRTDRLDQAVRDISASGGRAAAVTMDVTRSEDVERLVASAIAQFGRLDIMICNAGFGFYGRLEETSPEIMQRMMDVNFMGTFLGARAALPHFRSQNSGHLIFVSSIVGRRGIRVHGRVFGDQGGTGGAGRIAAIGICRLADPRVVRLPRFDRARSFVTPWRAISATT